MHERSVEKPVSTHADCPVSLSLSSVEEIALPLKKNLQKKLHVSVFHNAKTFDSFLSKTGVPYLEGVNWGPLSCCNITPKLSISSADSFPKYVV